jgi:ParB family chromosome partitioning protein
VATQNQPQSEPAGDRVWNIAIDKLVPGVYQPRKHFNKESLQELASSIKINGVIQPISVRKRKEGGFEILAGERRWRAAQIANLHEVPALIKTLSDREALQLALIENIQREDLDPIEEAESYQRLIEEFNLSQQEAAEKVGKERSSVANALRLLSLPIEVKDLLTLKSISVGHAKVLLSVVDRKSQIELAKKVQNMQLSVRALEQEIKKQTNQSSNEASPTIDNHKENLATKLAKELADQLQKALGTKVEIPYNKGKGQIVLHYYSDDQLTSLYEKLKTT